MNLSPDFETAQRPAGATAFRLIETMRWEAGRVAHAERHVARLRRSAQRFGMACAAADVRRALRAAAPPPDKGPHRLRLTLGASGDLDAEAAPLEENVRPPLRLTLAGVRAHSADPFFRHKTTWRRVYRRAFAAAQAEGFDEALLLNERGEVTEGTRANVFAKIGGTLCTPPVRCGLLPGIGRAAWLKAAGAEERVLHPADLRAAEALWLVSALRGRRRAGWGTE